MPSDTFRGLSREELDAQYDLRGRVTDHQAFFDSYDALSEQTRNGFRGNYNVSYGPDSGQKLDIFPASEPGAPVVMFIHGGYWRSLDKGNFSFVAMGLAPASATVAVINYDLAPSVDMDVIVRQCREAAVWLHDNASNWNGDGQRLYLSGHSAGGHLAAMILATDWSGFTENRIHPGFVRGMVAISGLYDLDVLRSTFLNADLRLDAHAAARNSPVRLAPFMPRPHVPVHLAVGIDETDEFHRNLAQYADALDSAGVPVTAQTMPGHHHFSIIEELAEPNSALSSRFIQMIQADAQRENDTI
ncbi:MAG: alpha/beta hydrolase [Pseudomonadota bacterium]